MTTNHVFSAFSFIGFILISDPFAWHLEVWNTATCLYMFWVSLANLTFFVNSVVWDGNVVNRAQVWCDISTRIIIGTNTAIPATCLCIQRRLYHVVRNRSAVMTNRKEKRRLIIVDMMIGLGLPILNIVMAYVIQNERYVIQEDFGCAPSFANTILGVFLIPVWTIAISLISSVYGCLNIYHFRIKRRNIALTLSTSRYIRLLMLSGIDLVFTIPLSIWALTTWFPLSPWQSWATIHANQSSVVTISAAVWRSTRMTLVSTELTRWIAVVYALIFFMLFGFAEEAKKYYTETYQSVGKKVGFQTGSLTTSKPGATELQNLQPTNSMRPYNLVPVIFSKIWRPNSSTSNDVGSLVRNSKSTAAASTNFDPCEKYVPMSESTPSNPV